MKTAEIREQFLEYFRRHGHTVCSSSSLVPEDDPTLLFTNAGMVQFKNVFLGQHDPGFTRAATAQKCVRAGGKHNDLEEVGRTTRHHTFFEMLGNFSFGDYFKRDAIRYAWEFMTEVLGLDRERFYATVHHSDDEAAELWAREVGLPADRIYRLGDKDNFWQMADTGPCGPCSELHYDLRGERTPLTGVDQFVELNESGVIIELWNLVFMQFDRDQSGNLEPLPAPCVDTGAGLERITAVLQGADSNYHTDAFAPLLHRVAQLVGRPYDPASDEGVAYRVLADHARAVAFLLADGVFPSSEGRGYVLRRILRRAVRHAWLLGRREPTLVGVVEAVVGTMRGAYPELEARREHLARTTRAEEERFLQTIEGGLDRFQELASGDGGTISGEDAFKLYDTFGFPLDLTEVMARERGYEVDVEGFQRALESQRARSRADRATLSAGSDGDGDERAWTWLAGGSQQFVGYERLTADTRLLGYRWLTPKGGTGDHDELGVVLEENPFYLESGGQVSDIGRVEGDGWKLQVERLARVGDQTAVFGPVSGTFPEGEEEIPAVARVPGDLRHDTVRNHTATHLLHAALRTVLGDHVVQRGSLVAPQRLRFDFAHHAPLTSEERARVEEIVNRHVWEDHPVRIDERAYRDAVAAGAMALFGEKYGDRVRVVEIPGVSTELCGGTHARHTGEIGLFRIVSESGVAAGVRRIEALTGPAAFRYLSDRERRLEDLAGILKTSPDNVQARAEGLLAENRELEGLLADLRAGGGAGARDVVTEEFDLGGGGRARYRGVRLRARDADDAKAWGDGFVASGESGVAVIAAELPEERRSLFVFVTDDLIGRGLRADEIVREVAEVVGGRGGGRPHMAQAGVGDPSKLDEALGAGADRVRERLLGTVVE